jgi:gliding motility-associated-like protein
MIFIFDRFGKLIKQISPDVNDWDSTYNAQPPPSTDFWFAVNYMDLNNSATTKIFKSHFYFSKKREK